MFILAYYTPIISKMDVVFTDEMVVEETPKAKVD